MSESLADLFDHGEDFPLCDRLFVRICDVHGNRPNVATLNDAERTVYLVWGALGVIGNGGFRYLFESDVEGDPDYALTHHAFEVIGCDEAVAAISQALSAFPGGRPPSNPSKRIREYQRQVPLFPSPADRAFFAADGLIKRCLATWVRSRQRDFAHLA
jgi:hypothetical protein